MIQAAIGAAATGALVAGALVFNPANLFSFTKANSYIFGMATFAIGLAIAAFAPQPFKVVGGAVMVAGAVLTIQPILAKIPFAIPTIA